MSISFLILDAFEWTAFSRCDGDVRLPNAPELKLGIFRVFILQLLSTQQQGRPSNDLGSGDFLHTYILRRLCINPAPNLQVSIHKLNTLFARSQDPPHHHHQSPRRTPPPPQVVFHSTLYHLAERKAAPSPSGPSRGVVERQQASTNALLAAHNTQTNMALVFEPQHNAWEAALQGFHADTDSFLQQLLSSSSSGNIGEAPQEDHHMVVCGLSAMQNTMMLPPLDAFSGYSSSFVSDLPPAALSDESVSTTQQQLPISSRTLEPPTLSIHNFNRSGSSLRPPSFIARADTMQQQQQQQQASFAAPASIGRVSSSSMGQLGPCAAAEAPFAEEGAAPAAPRAAAAPPFCAAQPLFAGPPGPPTSLPDPANAAVGGGWSDTAMADAAGSVLQAPALMQPQDVLAASAASFCGAGDAVATAASTTSFAAAAAAAGSNQQELSLPRLDPLAGIMPISSSPDHQDCVAMMPSGIVRAVNASALAVQQHNMKIKRQPHKPKKMLDLQHEVRRKRLADTCGGQVEGRGGREPH